MPTFEALSPLLTAIISAIIGPLLVFFVSKTYTDRTIKRNNKQIIDQIEDVVIGDHTIALETLNKTLVDYLKRRVKSGPLHLELKLIAVAMTFSWDFIVDKLPKILEHKDFESVSVNLSVCFVDCDYLSNLNISTEGRNWGDISRRAEKSIPGFKKLMRKFDNRFTCEFHTYENLPHWHGWLVTERGFNNNPSNNEDVVEYLFLGRTRWENITGDNLKRKNLPKLTVGQNEYRLYTNETKQGRSRISLFEQWHAYYFERVIKKKI
ncbi:MAG: hypothetical protein IPL71_05590 [Anaerolineales bacterium]|uniref:hypothetical protein n=1 Tax=Candidatus Villigracilis proximus TaxID=3140683 RepID=UPI00313659EC|nr:hypothetical protein [Anaerolineales bacterium]